MFVIIIFYCVRIFICKHLIDCARTMFVISQGPLFITFVRDTKYWQVKCLLEIMLTTLAPILLTSKKIDFRICNLHYSFTNKEIYKMIMIWFLVSFNLRDKTINWLGLNLICIIRVMFYRVVFCSVPRWVFFSWFSACNSDNFESYRMWWKMKFLKFLKIRLRYSVI